MSPAPAGVLESNFENQILKNQTLKNQNFDSGVCPEALRNTSGTLPERLANASGTPPERGREVVRESECERESAREWKRERDER